MPEGSCAFQVGTFRCTVLSDGYANYPAEWYFANVEPEQFRRELAGRRLPQDHVLCPFACLLVECGRHVALFDAGAGPAASTSGAVAARLEVAGVRPRDVDTVVLSHAHPDHLGGTLDLRGKPAFPHARHVLSEVEWEFWKGRANLAAMGVPEAMRAHIAASARDTLTALRYQVELVQGEREILPGMRVVPAPGHTPGHMAMVLESEGETLLAMGDAALHPLHLERPQWSNALDLEPGCAALTRRALLERAATPGVRVLGFHFPFPSVGRVEPVEEGGWRWSPGW